MMMWRACLCSALGLNGVWDGACAFAMVERLHTNDVAKGFAPRVFLSHWALWSEESHRSHVAQRALFACLVLQWGCIRLITASHYYYYNSADGPPCSPMGLKRLGLWPVPTQGICALGARWGLRVSVYPF